MNVRLSTVLFLAVASSALAAACGGGQPDAQTPPAASAAPPAPPAATSADAAHTAPPAATTAAPPASTAATPPPPPKVWKEATTKEQKSAFMKDVISPRMAKVFQTQDAKRYAEFGCKTCHGPKYQAPKDFLPKLTMKGGKFAGKPEVLKFMGEKVVPEMAAAMGEKPYDPATKEGFGCGGCHTIEVK